MEFLQTQNSTATAYTYVQRTDQELLELAAALRSGDAVCAYGWEQIDALFTSISSVCSPGLRAALVDQGVVAFASSNAWKHPFIHGGNPEFSKTTPLDQSDYSRLLAFCEENK